MFSVCVEQEGMTEEGFKQTGKEAGSVCMKHIKYSC